MDDRERQTFMELQMKLVDHTNKLKTVQQQMATLAKMGRRAALTAEELSSVPEDARTYNTIGRAHFLAPKAQIIDDLVERQHAYSGQIDGLKASKGALEKGLKGVEAELRELLQSSPALARQISQQAG